ncbi:MAG TPA: AmmeMemoRadiSam system protein B, partial [Bryobacteraceae bacterium]|nr:AmmeMemoRadiSam system protein B [Bryobacteraceae bacterium]
MADSGCHISPFSGTWYPDSREELTALLDELWRKSEQRTGSYVQAGAVAFVAPHAGLAYSGTVAAAVYRHLELARPHCVIVAGFAHRGAPPGIWIPEIESYSTPLGRVLIDAELVRRLTAGPPFGTAEESRICDHSVEIQLPLLQKAAPGARIVPLYVGHLDQPAR